MKTATKKSNIGLDLHNKKNSLRNLPETCKKKMNIERWIIWDKCSYVKIGIKVRKFNTLKERTLAAASTCKILTCSSWNLMFDRAAEVIIQR